MKWWIKKNGRPEGPFSESDIRKRIALNMLGSLDRVSSDGSRWAYLKDTVLWRSAAPQPTPLPFSVAAESDLPAVTPKISDRQPPSVPIPERLRQPQAETSPKKFHAILVWGVCGGLAAAIAVLLVAWGVISVVRSKPDGFGTVKDKIALIKCRESSGTGFLLGMDGKTYLMSNEHVVRSSGAIEARLLDGTLLRLGEFSVAADGRDLARFEVLDCKNKPLMLRTSLPNVGEQVTVYGNSLGGGVATESKGFIQGVGPTKIETNAEIVQGNSGSPLLDGNNVVVGVAALLVYTGKKNWSNRDTRYEDKVRRYAVRLNGVNWKTIGRDEYEKQVREFEDFKTFWNYLLPYLFLETGKVPEEDLVYNDLCSKNFSVQETGFNDMLKEVAKKYEKSGKAIARLTEWGKGREELIRRLGLEIDSKQLTKDAAEKELSKYDAKMIKAYEKMKEECRGMILIRKEALNHAQTFLTSRTWDAPQVANGYDDGSSESVAQYRSWVGGKMELMNQKLKDLNKNIKEIEQGDDDDEDN